jgi:hypothetical protein
MTVDDVVKQVLQLVESYGPAVIGDLLKEVLPSLPIDDFVAIVNTVEALLQAQTEKNAMSEAAHGVDLDVDLAEQEALKLSGVK